MKKKNLRSGICTSLCSSSVVTLKMPCFFLSSAIWFGLLLGQLMVQRSKWSKKGSGNVKERLRDCWSYVPLRNYLKNLSIHICTSEWFGLSKLQAQVLIKFVKNTQEVNLEPFDLNELTKQWYVLIEDSGSKE